MTVLLAIAFIFLFTLLILVGVVAYHLLRDLIRATDAYAKFATQQSELALDAARQMSSRTPTELKSVLATIDKSVTGQMGTLMEAVRTAWSPTPDVHIPVSDIGQYKNPYPTPFYADEASSNDTSDPTDAYLPNTADRGPSTAVMDMPDAGDEGNAYGNPFGIDAPMPKGIMKVGI